jgi:hypothetical protein
MEESMNEMRTWAWLLGGLCFVGAWLSGALAPTMWQIWTWPTVLCLCLTSLCWAIYGWQRAREQQATGEGQAFLGTLWAIIPWLGFLALMIMPYALGVQQRMPT